MYVGFSVPEKQVRNGFNVTFSLVRKSNPKVHQRVRPLDSGERFKIPSGGILGEI